MDALVRKEHPSPAMKDLSQLPKLFVSFFKIGAFTFGGGYAMIPLIQRETVENHHWITDDDILDMLAIAESTPGVVAVNSATFVGYRVAGFWGALIATFGVALPSFIVISILSLFIMEYKKIQWLNWVFDGIRAGVVVLIFNAAIKLGKQCPKNVFVGVVIMLAFIGAAVFNLPVIGMLILAAIAGIVREVLLSKKGAAKEGEQ